MRVGDYELEQELGRGGMGAVYRARHVELGRYVALKRLLKLGGKRQARFEVEAQALGKLRHPNIVTVHDVGIDAEGLPFIAMGLVEGESLADLLRRGPLPPQRAAEIARGVAQALDHAHRAGILHRDVKPGNVLIRREDGAAVLTDFGLARELTEERERLTRTGQLVGTPHFMAPEQAASAADLIGPETDVYAVGATLYAMLTGEPPIKAEGGILALVAAICEREPDPPGADPRIDAITLTCLAKQPAQRYPDAGELALDLERYLTGTPISAITKQPGRGARRGLALGVTIAIGVAIAVVGLVASAVWPPQPASVKAPAPSPTTSEEPERAAKAAEALSTLAREADPERWRREARRWLARYADQPQAADLRARYQARGFAMPHAYTVTGPSRPYTVFFTTPHRLVGLRDLDSRFDLWDLRGGQHQGAFGQRSQSTASWAVYAPGSKTVLQRRGNAGVVRWSLAQRRPVRLDRATFSEPLESGWAVSASGHSIAILRVFSTESGRANRAEVFDLRRPKAPPRRLDVRPGWQRDVRFAGERLVFYGEGEVVTYDVSSGPARPVRIPGAVFFVAGHAGTQAGVVIDRDGRATLVDLASGRRLSDLAGTPRVKLANRVAATFTPDGKRLFLRFAGAPSTWETWALDPPRRLSTSRCGLAATHPQQVQSLVLSPDGARLAGVSWNDDLNVIVAWEIGPGEG